MAKSRGNQAKERQQRKGPRTPWHLLLFLLLQERAPKTFQVRSEVPLGRELPRADVVLLRRKKKVKADQAQILRGLWPLIARDAVVEFKSVAHGFRRGELGKLLAYAGLYYWLEAKRLGGRDNLLTALLVPSLTPTLTKELADLAFIEVRETEGYRQYGGGTFPLVVAEVDRVAESERDELLGFLGQGTLRSDETRRWLCRVTGFQMAKMKEMDEYEDYEAKLFEALGEKFLASLTPEQLLARYTPEISKKVLASMPPEQRLAGLDPQQRLAGLDPQQRLAGLDPQQRLAGLTEDQKAELRRLLEEQN